MYWLVIVDVYTAKRDTCTGCATNCDDPNNIFTVGFQDYDFWGYDNPVGTSSGTFSSKYHRWFRNPLYGLSNRYWEFSKPILY